MTFVVIASALIVAGAIGLYWPTTLDAHDRWGFPISCGSGFTTNCDQAATADQDSASAGQPQARGTAGGYVAACRSAIKWRRIWATSSMVIGAVGLTALQLRRRRSRQPTSHVE